MDGQTDQTFGFLHLVGFIFAEKVWKRKVSLNWFNSDCSSALSFVKTLTGWFKLNQPKYISAKQGKKNFEETIKLTFFTLYCTHVYGSI